MQDGNAVALDRVDEQRRVAGSRENGLKRVFDILKYLHSVQRPVAIGDLARGTNAPRSTTYSLVRILAEADLLKLSGDGVYFGPKLYLYGMDYMRGNDLLRRGRQEVDMLARETGETSEMCLLQSGRATIVHSSPVTRPLRIGSAIGQQAPLPWTACGRLLLAGCDRTKIEAMVSDADLVLPDGRRLLLDDFLDDIAAARGAGYSVMTGLVETNTKCLAAPVFSAPGHVEATIGLVIPIDTDEARIDELVALLRGRAAILSIATVPN